MLSPDRRLSSRSEHERLLRARARAEAQALFRVHGGAALGLIRMTHFDAARDAEDRRSLRLTLIELERLDRAARASPPPAARTEALASLLTLWRRSPLDDRASGP